MIKQPTPTALSGSALNLNVFLCDHLSLLWMMTAKTDLSLTIFFTLQFLFHRCMVSIASSSVLNQTVPVCSPLVFLTSSSLFPLEMSAVVYSLEQV